MKPLLYATTNPVKFRTAQIVCEDLGVQLEQVDVLDVPEIQALSGEEVARDKAQRTFEAVKKPIIISDDSWIIPALGNFPGPFMKFINKMLTTDDWLRLTKSLTDRRIVLKQIIVYQDHEGQQLFSNDIEGILLIELRGQSPNAAMAIVSFDNGQTSVAENLTAGHSAVAKSSQRTSWHSLCEWYQAKTAAK